MKTTGLIFKNKNFNVNDLIAIFYTVKKPTVAFGFLKEIRGFTIYLEKLDGTIIKIKAPTIFEIELAEIKKGYWKIIEYTDDGYRWRAIQE